MHKSVFHTNHGDVLLFPGWILHTRKETYLTCLVLIVLGIVYQGVKFARRQYGRRCRNINCKRYILNKGHLLQTLMYLFQFVGGYVLMLSVMTYNVWLLLAVLGGFGLGYFFFGWGDYEEPLSSQCALLAPSSRSYFHACGGLTPSSSATQELLASSKSEQDMNTNEEGASNIRCMCSSKV